MIFWDNIKVFYLIVKYNSFQIASDMLKIHISSVSRKIQRLEIRFAQPLFITKKRVILTPFGEQLFNYINNSCINFMNINKQNFNIDRPSISLKIYISDIYFYNLLLHLYEKKSLSKEKLDINNVSLMEPTHIQHLMHNNVKNFVYISGVDIHKDQYISLPIYNVPILLYQNLEKNDSFILYNGSETWLQKMHEEYLKNNIYNQIIYSNSIDIISKLIHCKGVSLLPNIYSNYYGKVKKPSKIYQQQLFFIFHQENLDIRSMFY